MGVRRVERRRSRSDKGRGDSIIDEGGEIRREEGRRGRNTNIREGKRREIRSQRRVMEDIEVMEEK